jgi:hypothetical protein
MSHTDDKALADTVYQVTANNAARQSGCEDGVNLDEKVSPDA